MRLSKSRLLLVTALLVLLAVLAYGFAASNTVEATYAGDGNGNVSGYYVKVGFTLDSTDPTKISEVKLSFYNPDDHTQAVAANHVQVTLDGSNWLSCSADDSSNTTWTCNASANVVDILSVRVIATQ